MSVRQGSASFTIAIGAIAALIVGAIVLTFMFFPIISAFFDAAFWGSLETTPGVRLTTTIEGVWLVWPAVILVSILSFVWVSTRQ